MTRGTTVVLNIAVTTAGGAPYSLAGCVLKMAAARVPDDALPVFETDSSPGGSITISEPAADGLAVAKILPAHTLGLPRAVTKLSLAIRLVAGADEYDLATLSMIVVPGVPFGGA